MNIKQILLTLLCSVSFLSIVEAAEKTPVAGYISENLFVYMHSGSGKNYRILGSINSGEKVQLTGQVNNDYTQVITDKDKTGWVESKYISTKPGMRYAIADLNEKLASLQAEKDDLKKQLSQTKSKLDAIHSERNELKNNISDLNIELTETKSQLKNQDTDVKKQWFFTGAIVLGIGLFLGLILPRLFAKRKSNMQSWG